jgi:hypothetical protein
MKATQGGNFKAVNLPEPQTTVARCVSLIDIGTVENMYKGQSNGKHHRIFLTWELPKLLAVFNDEKGQQPFVVSEELTLSTADNGNLSKLIANWRGRPLTPEEQKEFDPTVMVGKTCLIQFIHKIKPKYSGQNVTVATSENTNMKVGAVMNRPKEMEIPEAINPLFIWDWDEVEKNGFKQEEFDKIPKFLQQKIMSSEEYIRLAPAASADQGDANPQTDQSQASGPVAEDGW